MSILLRQFCGSLIKCLRHLLVYKKGLSWSVTYDRSVVSLGTPVSAINKTDRHDKTEILLKVALKHHNPNRSCTKTFMLGKG